MLRAFHNDPSIKEGLRPPYDTTWPADFLQAIPVGADLAAVPRQFLLVLLTDPQHGVRQYVQDTRWRVQREAIDAVIALLEGGDALVPTARAAEAVALAAEAAEAAEATARAARAAEAAGAAVAARAAEAAEAVALAARAAGAAARAAGAAAWAARAAGAAGAAAGAAAWAAARDPAAARAAENAHFLWQRSLLLALVAHSKVL